MKEEIIMRSFGAVAIVLAIVFVFTMAFVSVKYYLNKNEKLNDLPEIPKGRAYTTNDEVIWFASHADVHHTGDTISITLYNPFSDFEWTTHYVKDPVHPTKYNN